MRKHPPSLHCTMPPTQRILLSVAVAAPVSQQPPSPPVTPSEEMKGEESGQNIDIASIRRALTLLSLYARSYPKFYCAQQEIRVFVPLLDAQVAVPTLQATINMKRELFALTHTAMWTSYRSSRTSQSLLTLESSASSLASGKIVKLLILWVGQSLFFATSPQPHILA